MAWLRRFAPIIVGVALLVASGAAHAGTFDPWGNFSFDPSAVVTQTFDDVTPQTGVTAVRAGDAIQGAAYVNVNTTTGVSFPLATPATDAAYIGRMFARTNRVVAAVNVTYADDGGSPSFGARFYPSGTVTSDGWYEVITNTFSIQGSRNPVVSLAVLASGADVDAFELDASGQFKALATCSPPFDAACSSNEFCGTGWCNDGNTFVPPLPPVSSRADVIAYFESRLSTFFGGRYSRLNYLPNALNTLEGLQNSPDAWTFWNGIVTAIHQLHDWHTTINGPVSINGQGLIPVCFDEGTADLSQALAPSDPNYYDVLVTHVGPAATLVPGDRLVAINGMHPFAFVESLDNLDWGMWRADDPTGHSEAAERLIPVIRRYATNITIIHCDPTSKICQPPQTIAVADLPYDDGNNTYPYCDHRPLYHLGSNGPNPVTHDSYDGPFYGVVTDSMPGENIYSMVWDDVYLDNTDPNPYLPAYTEFQSSAGAVILDHRLGNGGNVPGATYLTSLFRTPATIAAWAGFNLTVGEFDNYTTSFGLSLYSEVLGTGGYQVGSNTANTTLPVALLLERDGSASDWFPRGMRGGSPNIRVFGRHTAGAFSSYFFFDYYSDFSWRIASGDLLNPDGTTNLGTGVQPDQEIVPLQSDLLSGVDTVYAAALDWVRTCTTCRQ